MRAEDIKAAADLGRLFDPNNGATVVDGVVTTTVGPMFQPTWYSGFAERVAAALNNAIWTTPTAVTPDDVSFRFEPYVGFKIAVSGGGAVVKQVAYDATQTTMHRLTIAVQHGNVEPVSVTLGVVWAKPDAETADALIEVACGRLSTLFAAELDKRRGQPHG